MLHQAIVMREEQGETLSRLRGGATAKLREGRHIGETETLDAGGTVMQFVGDAVMAVFGAPLAQEDRARYATVAATAMHRAQHAVNERWRAQGLPEFGLGIGLSSGRVAAALLGSEERLEYSLVGDAVNLAQRLQQWAEAGQTVLSQATAGALGDGVALVRLEQAQVTGWDASVHSYRLVEGGT